MDCRSFFNFSGYRESDDQQKFDFTYLVDHREHISKLQNQLALELKNKLPSVGSCCEIGYGIGLFLKACTYLGIKEYGFEVNPYAAKYARETVAVDCEEGVFGEEHTATYDLFAAIGVFEHIEQPRALFGLMRRRLNRDGAIYISVPFVERRDWPYLWDADKRPGSAPPDPFYDNDVHIIHYSIDGLTRLGMSFGAREAEFFVSKDVVSNSPGAYPGILFRF